VSRAQAFLEAIVVLVIFDAKLLVRHCETRRKNYARMMSYSCELFVG
jgi:hypothetical protein